MRSSLLFAAAAALFVIPSFVLASNDSDAEVPGDPCPGHTAVSTPGPATGTNPSKACPGSGAANCNYFETFSLAWSCVSTPGSNTKCVADPAAKLKVKIEYRCNSNNTQCIPTETVILTGAGLKTVPCTPVTGGNK
ncbi:MAG: hypothetical protein JNJ88_03325 [Planctomycetes bacterium]|nr:hypothetical protein [Planctomycetota bacterium]